MARLRYNNSGGVLGAALTAGATTITFAAAPPFATLAGTDYIPLCLDPAGSALPNPSFEIAYLTAYTLGATSGTITRGQEGTTGKAHNNGAAWAQAPTAADIPDPLASNQPGDLIVSAAGTRAGCLLCQGQAVSRTTYAALFAAIATTYGVGDGSSTFNIPDFRGRTIVGAGTAAGAAGATAHGLGQVAGEETHQLSVTEMPVHNHGTLGGNFVTDSGTLSTAVSTGTVVAGDNRENVTAQTGGSGGVTVAHNNLQPFGVANVFIKY
jgi:microcystin-dependent protein